MRIVIAADVPDDWRDDNHPSGILLGPSEDIADALAEIGAENIDIKAEN